MSAFAKISEDICDPTWAGKVFLWQEQALFIGEAADTSLHASPAIKICIAIDGEFDLRTSAREPWKSFRSAIIAPGQIHAIDGKKNNLALMILVPEALMAQTLAPIYTQQGLSIISRSAVQKLLPFLQEFTEFEGLTLGAQRNCGLIVEKIRAEDDNPKANKQNLSTLDPRVAAAIEQLRAENASCGSVKEIAANVSLSESRFSHLFSEQLGVSVRRYLLWLRLREAMHLLAAGSSLTATAHEAGFSDSAHLTRTFRTMLGIAPTALIKHSSLIPAKE